MFATAPATARPARSSRGREMMRTTRPPVVDGLSLALQAASSDTSTSTTARIQASYAIVTDFFNGLLGVEMKQVITVYGTIVLLIAAVLAIMTLVDHPRKQSLKSGPDGSGWDGSGFGLHCDQMFPDKCE